MPCSTRTLLVAMVACSPFAYGQADVRGGSDHPLFPNRMPGYHISNYRQEAFGSYRFRTRPPKLIEGKYTRIHYYLDKLNEHPGVPGILRNYENAIKAAGGQVVHSTDGLTVLKGTRNGVEIWAEVQAGGGRIYFLNVIELEAMQQVIQADAMGAAIDKDGFIALDVHFATGKADILPESQPLIGQIVDLLRKRPSLRLGVEGHTDNTGTPAGNQQLSLARAKSVVAALAAAGIAGNRLAPAGFGQDKPIADNRTDEGRAKNRRVELVRKP